MKKIIISALLTLFCTDCLYAQSVEDVLHIRMAAIECFRNYIQKTTALDYPNRDNRFEFTELFQDNALIYNNFLPSNQPIYISPEEYAEDKRSKSVLLNHHFTDLQLGFPYEEYQQWKIAISYTEEITVENIVSGIKYPQCTFHGNMIIAMDRNKAYENISHEDVEKRMPFINPRICKIDVSDPIMQFALIRKTEDMEAMLSDFKTIPNIASNPYYIAIESDSVNICSYNETNEAFFYKKNLTTSKEDRHIYEFKTIKKDLFGLDFLYTPYGFGNQLNKTNVPGISLWSQTLGLNLFYGMNLASYKNTTLFFNAKLGINTYLNRFKGTWSQQFNATDQDGEDYLRKIQLQNTSEKTSHLGLSLQPSLEYLIEIFSWTNTQKLFLSIEVGGYAECRFRAANTFYADAAYSGLYDYFGGVEFTHYYDFGNFTLNDQNVAQNLNNKLNLFDYGAFGSIGVWYALNSRHLFKAALGYKHGFTTPFSTTDNYILSWDLNRYESLTQTMSSGLKNLYLNVSYIVAFER